MCLPEAIIGFVEFLGNGNGEGGGDGGGLRLVVCHDFGGRELGSIPCEDRWKRSTAWLGWPHLRVNI
jgi:hypothetical protein